MSYLSRDSEVAAILVIEVTEISSSLLLISEPIHTIAELLLSAIKDRVRHKTSKFK